VDEPLAINPMKRFVADYARLQGIVVKPQVPPDSGHKIAVIGGGPGGLACAYYLRLSGHSVTIFEALPKLGGLLRYAIPEYRLPKAILDEEIQGLLDMGVDVKLNQRLGKDFTLAGLREDGYEASFLAIGSWKGTRLGLPGEDQPGIISALDYLSKNALGTPVQCKGKVLVIGGGNAAMDAARTALRLGSEKVTLLYRRSRAEMPAHHEEVSATEHEGVQFEFLVSPTQVISKDGRFHALEFIRNILKEADGSGRARPVPIPGSETRIEAELMIIAIGQSTELTTFGIDPDLKSMDMTKWGTPMADPNTLQSSIPDLFVGGDLLRGPQTVIQAIADGRRAAVSIHQYLSKEAFAPVTRGFNISRGKALKDVDPVNFEGVAKASRVSLSHLPLPERELNFSEVEGTISTDQALAESVRCLSCGCMDAFECRLREFAKAYNIDISALAVPGRRIFSLEDKHPFISVDPNKCIACEQCVLSCSTYQIQNAFELIDTPTPLPDYAALLVPTINDRCVSCGLCVGFCPTGALNQKSPGLPGPFKLEQVKTTCSYCGVGCQIYLEKAGDRIIRVNGAPSPPNFGHLCVKGRFGFDFIHHPDRLKQPLIRKNGELVEASWDEALDLVSTRFREILDSYGPDATAVLTSARATNEENYLMHKFARGVLKTNNIDHCARL
jgi:formate dehydrogenase major subunit